MKNSARSEGGQILILLAVAIVGLMGFAALAIDGGMIYSDRRQSQSTADSAALAAAMAKVNGKTSTQITQKALQIASSNGYSNDGTTNWVEVHTPPADGPYQGMDNYVQVKITSKVNTSFAYLFYNGEVKNSVEAIARAEPEKPSNALIGEALVSLAPSDCNTVRGHGNFSVDIVGGGIFVNSDADCAFSKNGTAGDITTESFSIVGNYTGAPGNLPGDVKIGTPPTKKPTTGVDPIPYPPNFGVGKIDCPPGNDYGPGEFPWAKKTDLTQGQVYCVTLPFSHYWSIGNGELNGQNVFLYIRQGTSTDISVNGNYKINLTAMDTGPHAGMVMYIDAKNYAPGIPHGTFKINGTSNVALTGTVFAPTYTIDFEGTTDVNTFHSQIIAYDIDMGGSSDLNINYNADENGGLYEFPYLDLTK